MRQRLLILVLMLALPVHIQAQKQFDTVSPPELEDPLIFDVNSIPVDQSVAELGLANPGSRVIDLNYSPNVVFSPDSSKAFVSFSGSDKVMVFDPKTGERIDTPQSPDGLITVGENPGQMTLTPDGTGIAVVSVFLDANIPKSGTSLEGELIGSISLIDVEDLSVSTLEVNQVFFSLANNVVFSGDGGTGFVASAGSDQILRFDVGSMTEISPRIDLMTGTRPATLTMAPDSSFLVAVLVGSTNLSRVDVPDSVAVIDPSAFTLLRTLAPETGPNTESPTIHDFVASNRVAIGADGRTGVIADQQLSALGLIPELTPDRVWFIDFEAGEVTGPVSVGGVASGAYLSPGGKVIVVSQLEITIIDLATSEGRVARPNSSNFRPSSRPALFDRYAVMAAPLSDALVLIDVETGEIPSVIGIGGAVVRNGRIVSSAPLDVAVSPDGKTITAVNFNASNVDLIRPTSRFHVPRVLSDDQFFTGVALTNDSATDTELTISGRSNAGLLLRDISKDDGSQFPEIIAPPADTALAGEAVTFSWTSNGAAVTDYQLHIGTAQGTSDIFDSGSLGTVTSSRAEGLPDNGNPVFVRLRWTLDPLTEIDPETGEVVDVDPATLVYQSLDVQYVAATDTSSRPEITQPVQGSILAGSAVTFLWTANGAAVTEYRLVIGSALAESDLFDSGPLPLEDPSATEGLLTVFDLPVNGQTLFARLLFIIDGTEEFADFQYVAPFQFINPRTLTVAAATQRAETAVELLKGVFKPPIDGWYKFDSDQLLPSFFMIGDRVLRRIDGAVASESTSPRLVVPDVRVSIPVPDEDPGGEGQTADEVEGTFNTELAIVNPSLNGTQVVVELVDEAGVIVEAVSLSLGGSQASVELVKASEGETGLFSDEAFDGFEGGYLNIVSDTAVLAFVRYVDDERMGFLNGVSELEWSASQLFMPQVAHDASGADMAETFLNLVNVGEESLAATLTLRNNAGQELAPPSVVELAAGERLRVDVATLFGLNGGDLVSGWIAVETTPGLVGSAEIRLFGERALTTLPLQSRAGKQLIFSHVAQGLGFSTGVVLINTAGAEATVTVEVFDPEGALQGSSTFVLESGARIEELLGEVGSPNDPKRLPLITSQIGGYIRVTSDQDLIGLELFFGDNLEFVSAVPAQRDGPQ